MGSRVKEEEKNEKIIRGLSKREENRKCINCGSLGPQYICTNFSTFVCTNCSGIHREFTHRVKSISMAKFTAAEVSDLQAGGNQRGREYFLKNWDSQRHTLPDSSSPDKLRDFIKAVYVNRRYVGDKPPQRGKQGDRDDLSSSRKSNLRSDSLSESEDRFENPRHNNRTLSRGSDGGRYEDHGPHHYDTTRSPGRFLPNRGRYDRNDQDRPVEDQFANEGWKSPGRFEHDRSRPERSAYMEGDRQYNDQFANQQKDSCRSDDRPSKYRGYTSESSPPIRSVREILGDDVPTLLVEENKQNNGGLKDAKELPSPDQSQKQLPPSNSGSAASSSISVKAPDLGSLIDFTAESDVPAAAVASDPFGITILQPPVQPEAASTLDPFGLNSLLPPAPPPMASMSDPAGILSLQPPAVPPPILSSDPFGMTSLTPPAQHRSTGWAAFDTNFPPEKKAEALPTISRFVGPANSGVRSPENVVKPAGYDDPSRSSGSGAQELVKTVGPAVANVLSGIQVHGQGDIHQTQKSTSSPESFPPGLNQDSQIQAPNIGRAPLPEDLFTPSFAPTSFPSVRVQMVSQLPMGDPRYVPYRPDFPGDYIQGGISHAYGNHPKSKNPFDLPGDATLPSAGAFPNMVMLHSALPTISSEPYSNPGSRVGASQWSPEVVVNPPPVPFSSTGSLGGVFYNPHPPTFVPTSLQQHSFGSSPRPSPLAGYTQQAAATYGHGSEFSLSQSSAHPVEGNPFG